MKLIYDFTHLDTFLDRLMAIGIYPVIEFMGNPWNVAVTNGEVDWHFLWYDLTEELVRRYTG